VPDTVWTIGHSTRGLDEFMDILRHYGIEAVVDVRTVPRSRMNPQFNSDTLGAALEAAGIGYIHAKNLGGLRKPRKDSISTAWQNESFRGFADYMQTQDFEEALARLIEVAEAKRTVILCAEILPWRCHRSLIADALTVRGLSVVEILDAEKSQPHKFTPFAVVTDGKITYPQSALAEPE